MVKYKKNQICRRLEIDFWGKIVGNYKISKSLYYYYLREEDKKGEGFSLRLDFVKLRKRVVRKSYFGKLLLDRKKICIFYGNLKRIDFNKLYRKAKALSGNLTLNMIYFLEMRLEVVVYRLGFAKTISESRVFVMSGIILVNRKVIKDNNYFLKIGDLIEVVDAYKEEVYQKSLEHSDVLLSNADNGLIIRSFKKQKSKLLKNRYKGINYLYPVNGYWFVPNYFEVNYSLMVGLIIRKPDYKDLLWPFLMNFDFFVIKAGRL